MNLQILHISHTYWLDLFQMAYFGVWIHFKPINICDTERVFITVIIAKIMCTKNVHKRSTENILSIMSSIKPTQIPQL